MKAPRILVVGGLAAGPSAAAKAARTNPKAEVTLFEQSSTVSYGLCEAPYAISGEIPDERRLVIYTPERLQDEKGIRVKIHHRVEKIIPAHRKIVVRDLSLGELLEYPYDKLILATGSSPRRLNVAGEDGRNVFHLASRDDTTNIIKYIESESPSRAVIIGGGYIGMEMSEALRLRGLDVTLLHRRRLPMAGLEDDTRERVFEELTSNGVHFITNCHVESLLQDKRGVVTHVISDKGTYEADLVILSLGVQPNVSVAKDARIRMGASGGILTDQRQQTNIDGVYAAGDCCELRNLVNGRFIYIPLATYASRQAWVAGENAAGGYATFKGGIRAIAVRIFGLEVAQVGLSADEARESNFEVSTFSVTARTKVGLMPESGETTIRMIVDRKSGRLIGANVFGDAGSVLRANVLGVAIQQKLTLDDIARLDLIYSPPFAPLWDPILVAANVGSSKK